MKLKSLTGSRAGRVALAAVPVGIAASLLMGGVAQGAVPVSMTISGQSFQVGAKKLYGEGFSQYAGVGVDASKAQHPLAISNIARAELTDLCQAVSVLGPIGLKITAGDQGTPVTAENLQIGMTDLKGDASFGGIRIGVDANTVNTAAKGTQGEFAQDADTVTITDLQQTALSTSAGVFNLVDLHLAIATNPSCF
ncbi:cholesterol esterase [Agromyces intestinalis]|uniref:Cholesterol esterase n=1 Tax=Agromyces intestinalis TaxID=2592652 RepID=A0A5C1YJV3_9MICO|nr:DUF6230 family protein [Agromyces intestinalis]QEO15439.1 cholesterol esterase [Agromyces intestinalis]